MSKRDVRKIYSLFDAKWYDSFKSAWNRFVIPEAEEDVHNFFKENLNENTSILELGCGTAKNIESIKNLNLSFKSYLGLDFTPAMLNRAVKKFSSDSKISFRIKDISDLSDLDEKFDIILCTWVMSHIESPSNVINQAQRLLNNDGKFYLVFMTKPPWYINFWFYPFLLLYNSRYVSDFEVEKINNIESIKRYSYKFAASILIGENDSKQDG